MSFLKNDLIIDFKEDEGVSVQPTIRFARLILYMAIQAGADRIVFSLEEGANTSMPESPVLTSGKTLLNGLLPYALERQMELSDHKFHVAYYVNGAKTEMLPSPSQLFPAITAVLCNYASVPYYSKGHVEGTISVKNPNLTLTLKSDDLTKEITLLRT